MHQYSDASSFYMLTEWQSPTITNPVGFVILNKLQFCEKLQEYFRKGS